MFLKNSDRLAIVDFDGTKINYNQMISNIKSYSEDVFLNLEEKDKVLIVAENRVEWVFSFFAIWDKKASPVAVDALSSVEELKYYINDCMPKAIIVSNQSIQKVSEALKALNLSVELYNLDEIKRYEKNSDRILNHPSDEDLAVMIYTSGTTGNPKGVMLTFANIIAEIEAIFTFEITFDDEQTLAILPFHHILPLMATCLYYYYYKNQMSVVFVEKLTSQEILKKLKENDVTMISAVPRVFKLFYKSISDQINSKFIARLLFKLAKKVNNKKFSKIIFKKVHDIFGGKLRTFIAGGAKSDPEMIEFFEVLGFNYCEGYGLSETAPVVAGSVGKNYKIGTVGKCVPSVEYKVENGELIVRGPMVMKGYYNKPEKTAEVLSEDGWFKTGDLVQIDEDGYITIVGRANSMIVLSNGKNIDPEKLEEKVMKLSDDIISEIGIFGKNVKLCAVIVPNTAKNISNLSTHIRDIIQIYNTKVHNYEKILDYKIVKEELPKTRVGKLRRFMLAEVFGAKKEKKNDIIEPDNLQYKALKAYIKKQKGFEVGPDENFEIEIGLDSLDLVELITYIENSFNLKINEDIIAKNSSLRLLSEYIIKNSDTFNESESNLEQVIENAKISNRKEGIFTVILKPIIYLLFKIYFRISIKGKDKIKDIPTIFIANHESFVDALALSLAIPAKVQKKTFYLALEKYFSNKFMNFIANNGNILKVNIEKDVKNSVEAISGILKNGQNMFIFPEGSRTKDGNLQEFKKLYAIIAKKLDVNICLIGIDGAYEAYSRFDKFPKPKKINVAVLGYIDPTDKQVDEIVNECYEIFRQFKEKSK